MRFFNYLHTPLSNMVRLLRPRALPGDWRGSPHWRVEALRPGHGYTEHIAPFFSTQQRLSPHFNQALKIISYSSSQGPLAEFVVARHRYTVSKSRLEELTPEERQKYEESVKDKYIAHEAMSAEERKEYQQKHGKEVIDLGKSLGVFHHYYHDIVSFLFIARPGSIKATCEKIQNSSASPLLQHLTSSYTVDKRAYWGFTTRCSFLSEREKINEVLKLANGFAPIDDAMRSELDMLLAEVTMSEEEYPSRIQTTKQSTQIDKPYFASSSALYIGGVFLRYRSEEHKDIKTELPLIHRTILEGDIVTLRQCLQEDPHKANAVDHRGVEAHRLAFFLEQPILLLECVNARDKIRLSYSDQTRQRNYHRILRDIGELKDTDKYEVMTQKVDEYLNLPILQRNALHVAAIAGDIDAVQEALERNKERLNEQDPFGFTPLALAVANNHVELARYLLQLDPSAVNKNIACKHPIGKSYYISLFDNAQTPEMIELLLHYHLDMNQFNIRLIDAIYAQDLTMVNYLLRYLQQLPGDKGLNAVEVAIYEYSPEKPHGLAIIQALLAYYPYTIMENPSDLDLTSYIEQQMAQDNRIPQEVLQDTHSPYHCNIYPEVVALLEQHNKRIERALEKQKNRPKLVETKSLPSSAWLLEKFSSAGVIIDSIIKPLGALTDSERNSIRQFSCDALEFKEDEDSTAFSSYIDEVELRCEAGDNKYVNLFFIEEKIVSFVVFELLEISDEEEGNVTVFYAKLAINNPEYDGYGLIKVASKLPLALKLKYPEKKVYTLMEVLAPGYALYLLANESPIPSDIGINYFPKYDMPQRLVKKIIEASELNLVGKVVPEKIRVKSTRAPKLGTINPLLEFHKHVLRNADAEDAMATIVEYDNEAIERYLAEFSFNGIDREKLLEHADLFEAILMVKNNLRMRAAF